MRLDQILILLSIIILALIAVFLARKYRAKPHRMLTGLIGANIVLDIIAIAIWIFPATQWSIYRLGFMVVGTEAGVAAALFALTLFGLTKRKKWALYLAIILTVTQRVFATYVFFPSPALALTLVWSLIIVFFAYTDIKTSKIKNQFLLACTLTPRHDNTPQT